MELTSFKCPNCGAEVAFRGSDFTVCEYCQSQIVLDGIADKAELERLRRENEEYLEQNSGTTDFIRKQKIWKRDRNIAFAVLGGLMFFGFLSVEYVNVGLGAILVLIGLVIAFGAPPWLAARYPSFDEERSVVVYKKGERTAKVFALYGLAILVSLMAVFLAAILAVGLGDDEEKPSDNVYVSSSTDEGADKAVNKWLNANTSRNGGKDYYRCTIPDKALKELTDDGSFYDMAKEMDTAMDYLLAHDSVTVTEVERNDALTVTQLRGAEKYFRMTYGCDVNAEKGYEYSFNILQSSEGYESREIYRELCAVELGYGEWKVIEKSASELKTYGRQND